MIGSFTEKFSVELTVIISVELDADATVVVIGSLFSLIVNVSSSITVLI